MKLFTFSNCQIISGWRCVMKEDKGGMQALTRKYCFATMGEPTKGSMSGFLKPGEKC